MLVILYMLSKIKTHLMMLKQLPSVNGAIVVMDPYTGRVLALSGGFSFKKVNLIEQLKH